MYHKGIKPCSKYLLRLCYGSGCFLLGCSAQVPLPSWGFLIGRGGRCSAPRPSVTKLCLGCLHSGPGGEPSLWPVAPILLLGLLPTVPFPSLLRPRCSQALLGTQAGQSDLTLTLFPRSRSWTEQSCSCPKAPDLFLSVWVFPLGSSCRSRPVSVPPLPSSPGARALGSPLRGLRVGRCS